MAEVDLFSLLSKFRARNDVESKIAFFKTHVPWVAPEAYLNIIYKPLAASAVKGVARQLEMPEPLMEFFRAYNGAVLFSGDMSIYGIHPPGTLLEREDRFLVQPFNIEDEGASWPPYEPERFLVFGGYWIGSRVCIDRANHRIHLFERGEQELQSSSIVQWPSLDEWLTNEINRISFLYDESGRRLVDHSYTLPRPGPWS